jgi:hypothetical protein
MLTELSPSMHDCVDAHQPQPSLAAQEPHVVFVEQSTLGHAWSGSGGCSTRQVCQLLQVFPLELMHMSPK